MLENCSWPGQLLGKLNAPQQVSASPETELSLMLDTLLSALHTFSLSILKIMKGKHLYFARKDLLTITELRNDRAKFKPKAAQLQSQYSFHTQFFSLPPKFSERWNQV